MSKHNVIRLIDDNLDKPSFMIDGQHLVMVGKVDHATKLYFEDKQSVLNMLNYCDKLLNNWE